MSQAGRVDGEGMRACQRRGTRGGWRGGDHPLMRAGQDGDLPAHAAPLRSAVLLLPCSVPMLIPCCSLHMS